MIKRQKHKKIDFKVGRNKHPAKLKLDLKGKSFHSTWEPGDRKKVHHHRKKTGIIHKGPYVKVPMRPKRGHAAKLSLDLKGRNFQSTWVPGDRKHAGYSLKKGGKTYYLYELRRNKNLHFFSQKSHNSKGRNIQIPRGYKVIHNKRTGLPLLAKGR